MNLAIMCIRSLFAFLSIVILGALSVTQAPLGHVVLDLLLGSVAGMLLTVLLLSLERLLRGKATLRTLNIIVLGLFIGAITATAVEMLVQGALQASSLTVGPAVTLWLQAILYLTTTFLALILTAQSADELHLTIPFVHFKPTAPKKRDLLFDASVLQDPRLIDLAASGLLDEETIIPRFILNELQEQSSGDDEALRNRARSCLEVIGKLESLPYLNLRYSDADFPDIKDSVMRLTRLARHLDANILTADINRVQQSTIEGVRVINIHTLSNALKPLMQKGEVMSIKIQRPGKDPQQGIGYLDDGTMVVINGGANYMSKTIQAQVLGVKHTSSGRMIFCNALEEEGYLRPSFTNGDRELITKRYLME